MLFTHRAGVSVFIAAEFVQGLGEDSVFIEVMCSRDISVCFLSPHVSVCFSWSCSTYEMLSGPCCLTVKLGLC